MSTFCLRSGVNNALTYSSVNDDSVSMAWHGSVCLGGAGGRSFRIREDHSVRSCGGEVVRVFVCGILGARD